MKLHWLIWRGGGVGGEAISVIVNCSVTNDVIAVTSDVRHHPCTIGLTFRGGIKLTDMRVGG